MKWCEIQLGEILEVQSGFAFKSDFFSHTEGISLIRIRDLPRSTTEIKYNGSYREEFLVRRGDYLIGMDGDFSCYIWEGEIGLLNQRVCRLTNFSSLVKPKYIYYRIQSELSKINSNTSFVTVKHISSKKIEEICIPIPPISEQRRIVEILDQADALRRMRAEADAKAERILPALFIKMFGDPATNPMGWEMLPISDLAEVQGGLQLTPKRENYPITMPYLRVANIYRNKLALDEIKYIKVTKNELERIALQSNDILIVEGHGNRQEIGRCAIWDASIQPCLHQNHLIRVRVDKTKVEPIYISDFINSSGGREQLFRFGKTTSGLNTISVSNVRNTMIPIPPLTLQKSYALKVQAAKTIQSEIDKQREKIDKLFSCILQRAFSGELTAKWREAHMKELLAEIEEQAKALNLRDKADPQQLSLL